jgi:hypothetical protein
VNVFFSFWEFPSHNGVTVESLKSYNPYKVRVLIYWQEFRSIRRNLNYEDYDYQNRHHRLHRFGSVIFNTPQFWFDRIQRAQTVKCACGYLLFEPCSEEQLQ